MNEWKYVQRIPNFYGSDEMLLFPKSIFHGDTVAHVDHLHLLPNQKIHLTISKVDTWIRGFSHSLDIEHLKPAHARISAAQRGQGRIVFQGLGVEYLSYVGPTYFCCCS